MKKLCNTGLCLLMVGALVASCADYNETYDFRAQPDPSYTKPYADLAPVKSYINKSVTPNLSIGATLDIKEFNKQELAHAAVITNFDNVSFGKTLMSGNIISSTGVMNFIQLNDLLEHMDEIGGEVYGSPIVANANQADSWIAMLTAPIEISVDYVPEKAVDYTTIPVGAFDGTKIKGTTQSIKKHDGQSALNLPSSTTTYIIEGFDIEPGATYTTTFYARADKDASFNVNFSGMKVDGTASKDGKWMVSAGKWTKIVVESQAAEGVTSGYLEISMVRGSEMNIQKVDVGYHPDNHRPQTDKEISDTIYYALNSWVDGFMKINKGRITSFDLIDEPIDNASVLENGLYDLKHSTSKTNYYWQDVIGNENYAPVVAKVTRDAFAKYEGNLADLKFFISERGLEDAKKMESLKYWINIWDNNGAKIDGINAKVNLAYYENETKLADNKAAYETLLANLAATGKLIRISNFDIKYYDANGSAVTAAKITDEQRQKLADYNAYALKAYMSKIPSDKQAGISKENIVDTSSDPVGLWTQDAKLNKDWARTATYKAFCEALSGN